MHHRARDYTGHRWNYLTALEYVGSDGKKSLWKVRCDCGNEITMPGSEISKGRQKSCGCKTSELISAARSTHGMSSHPAYFVWRSMLDRCRLPTHQAWENYGGRGITVAPEWSTFDQFWEDMGPTYRAGLTLERVDNEAGYSPGNCRWATRTEQARNTRSSRRIDTPWGTMTVAEASDLSGIGVTTLLYRLSRGVAGSDLFTAPDARNRFTIS